MHLAYGERRVEERGVSMIMKCFRWEGEEDRCMMVTQRAWFGR